MEIRPEASPPFCLIPDIEQSFSREHWRLQDTKQEEGWLHCVGGRGERLLLRRQR